LEGVGLGEINGNFVGGDLVVDGSHGLELVLNLLLVEGVETDLHVLLAVKGHSSGLASNRGREANIFQNCLVNGLQGSASGSLLSSVSLGSLGNDGPGANDDDGPAELRLEVVHRLLADLVVCGQRAERDFDLKTFAG